MGWDLCGDGVWESWMEGGRGEEWLLHDDNAYSIPLVALGITTSFPISSWRRGYCTYFFIGRHFRDGISKRAATVDPKPAHPSYL